MIDVMVKTLYFTLQTGYLLIGLRRVELQDTPHLDLPELDEVFVGDRTIEALLPGVEQHIYSADGLLHIGGLLDGAILIYALLDKYLLERSEETALLSLVQGDLEFATQDVASAVYRIAKQFAHREKLRLLVANHTAVGRDRHFAVGEGIEGVDSLVRTGARNQMHHDACLFRGVIIDAPHLDLSLLHRREYRRYQRGCRLAEGKLGDDQRLIVELLYLGSHLDRTAARPIVIFRGIQKSSGLKIRKKAEGTVMKIVDSRIENLVEIMGQYLR